ncbi:hypothetical protein NM208_g13413 [Fusarium decemcellulare]|uniref:Uncharacterized protein n=1 Tax=Fusarium decemcellulare TaxID=57161 RepID=A0ACC1RJZ3_9HYPO|nr:hypothetical protein NM208_g13413 [Fusarium decemcellulare]
MKYLRGGLTQRIATLGGQAGISQYCERAQRASLCLGLGDLRAAENLSSPFLPGTIPTLAEPCTYCPSRSQCTVTAQLRLRSNRRISVAVGVDAESLRNRRGHGSTKLPDRAGVDLQGS